MDMRSRIGTALKEAMKSQDSARTSTLRLISAAIKNKDIALRGESEDRCAEDADVLSILDKMVKQRAESARAYEEGGRLDLAERERIEIGIIEEFLPKKLSEAEVLKAIDNAISDIKASSIRDMGRVIGALKSQYAGQMDFGRVGPMVKERLG